MAKKTKKTDALIDMMGEHASGVQVSASNEGLALISSLAQAQYDAALEVARLEDELSSAKEQLRIVAEVDLPEAMKECGVKDFTTTAGLTVKLKEDVNVGIAAPRREEAYQWLIDHEFGGLIKSQLGMSFDRDHLSDAVKLAEKLKKQGYEIDMSQSVHYQTLKAFVKERMADTDSELVFPLDLFGARPFQVAVVKPRK